MRRGFAIALVYLVIVLVPLIVLVLLVVPLDNAALTLADVGAGLIGSVFAIVTILVLSMFMVARGRDWFEAFLETRPQPQAQTLRRAGDRIAAAVSSYVAGALLQATIAAVLVGIVIAFSGSTGDLIIWIVFAVVYQQFENYVVQPRIQSRAVPLDPFIAVLAALIGGTLLGVLGALLAIPGAATVQIALREYLDYRRLAGAGNA